ncbi:hypothetical protein, partial [Burkholderia vietnamiensis]|uniref:hypothetical protein n=1 Tax=Burkholderia vietnamiensis TaxID=60552 RepID=UPI001CF5D467
TFPERGEMGQSFNTHHAVVLIARWPAGTSFTSATEQLLLRRTAVDLSVGGGRCDEQGKGKQELLHRWSSWVWLEKGSLRAGQFV